MHNFQRCLPSHWWSRSEGDSVLLTGQAIGAPLKLQVFHLRNEVILENFTHPFLTHEAQPLVPQLTGIVYCHVYFLPADPGMHKVECVDLLSSGHNQVSLAELHCAIPNATFIAFII